MPTLYNYLERTNGDDSPFSIGCTMESGRASALYIVNNITQLQDLYNIIRELIGDVSTNNSQGWLTRTLPVGHPIMPWYISGITNMRGVGGIFQQIINPFIPFTPEIQPWCLYSKYHIQVEFQPRPYPVYNDQIIGNGVDGSWYPEDDGGTTRQNFTYWKEWERFVDIDITPSGDSVTQQIGQMAFNSESLPQNARPFTAQPKLFLNNETLKFTWYCVPMSYYTSDNSYLRRFRGRVNQNTWNTSSMGTYFPGELLYLGCTLKRFTPPLGNTTVTIPGTNLTDWAKYVNIELMFSYTRRAAQEAPLNIPTNKNYVCGDDVTSAGHNAQPYFGSGNDPLARTFLYASTSPTEGPNSTPLWLSFPVEILFTNPDFSGHI